MPISMFDETELLRRYAEAADEIAFTELVRHKVDFVYSAALRLVGGDAQLAEEVTQGVFLDLARKAGSLTRHAALAGWLYTSTRFAAAKAVRARQRWHNRTREAQAMREIEDVSSNEPRWTELRPVLDAALGELNERDHEALLLRFFEDRPLADVGIKIGLSENSARMRVDRALDKLRVSLARRGVTSTAAALSLVLAQEAVTAAPAGLAASVAGTALAGVAGVGLGGGAAAAKFFSLMALSKLQVGIAGALGLAAIAALFLQHQDNRQLLTENKGLRRQSEELAALRNENQRLTAEIASARRPEELAPNDPPFGGMRTKLAAGGVTGGKFDVSFNADDPETARLMAIQQKGQIDLRYGALFKALGLSAEQREQLKKLLLDRQNVTRDVFATAREQGLGDVDLHSVIDKSNADVDTSIRELLGDAGYDQYKQFQDTLPQRALAEQLANRLNSTSSPLTSQQAEQLVQILAANTQASSGLPPFPSDSMMFHAEANSANGTAPVVAIAGPGMSMTPSTAISDAAVAQAQTILTPSQLEVLQQIQAEQQAAQALGRQMMNNIRSQNDRPSGK